MIAKYYSYMSNVLKWEDWQLNKYAHPYLYMMQHKCNGVINSLNVDQW